MKGPVDRFTDLGITTRWLVDVVPDAPFAHEIESEVAAALERHGLEPQKDSAFTGTILVRGPNDERIELERHPLYTAATGPEVIAGIRAHIALIAERHGRGRVWFLDAPVHIVKDDARIVMQHVSDSPYQHVLLRTYYAHEKQGAAS